MIAAPVVLAFALATLFVSSLAQARPLAATPAITSLTPGSATAGQAFVVVIAGAHFETSAIVKLNGRALAISSAVSDVITATASTGQFTTTGAFPLVVVTSQGEVTGTFQIVAGTPQLSVAPASLTVNAGSSVPFVAAVADIFGNAVTTDTVQWSSSVGTFSPNPGNTTTYTPPSTPATYLITATLQSTGQKVERQVTVQAGPATQIQLEPAASPINLVAGNTVVFTATLLDAANNPTPNGAVTWASVGGSFSGAGLTRVFSPTHIAGVSLVTATLVSNDQAQSRQVVVGPAPAAAISIDSSATSITAGNTAWFTATVRDAFGNVITAGDVTWVLANGPGSVANATPRSATFTSGAGTGTATVQASYPGLKAVTAAITVNAGPPAQLSLSPMNPTLVAGNTLAFTALVSDSFGNATSISAVEWTKVSGPGALTNAQARSVTFGSTVASPSVVRARITGASDVTTTVTVNPAGVARIALSPPSAALPVNTSQGFSAAAFDAFNNTLPAASFAWSSADTSKATVSATGGSATLSAKTVAGVFPALLRVSSGGITQTATITLTPGAPNSITLSPASAALVVSTSQTFDASVFDAWGNLVPNATLAWSVSGAPAGQIAATDADSARFTGSTVAGAYPAAVRVSTAGLSRTADITLTPGALNAVTLNPNGLTILPAGSIGIAATGRDRFGNPISGLTFNWSVVNGAGSIAPSAPGSASATFNAGTTAGSYPNAIAATTQGFTGRANVLISPDQVARIDVSPASATLQPAAQQGFFARGYDRFNNLIWPLEVSWAVSGTGLITKTGSVTATLEAGTIAGAFANAVLASTQGITGVASVSVNAGPLARIDVVPSVVAIGIGSLQPFNAAGFDAWGNPVPGFSASWSVSPASAGSFNTTAATTALFRAGNTPGIYNNAVRASNGAVNSAASVVVQPGTVAAVRVTPASASLPIGGVQVFTAAVLDGAGNPLPGLSVLWQVSPNAGTIVSSGPLTAAVRAGTTAGAFAGAVRASNGVFGAAADLAVQAGTAREMTISASPETLQTDGVSSSLIEVALTDAFGNPTGAGTPVQWEIVQCSGACVLSETSSQADAGGRARASIRSDDRKPEGASSTLIVRATAGTLSKTVTLAGQFRPLRLWLAMLHRAAPLNNHVACTALAVTPPHTVVQPANRPFNIYRFVATGPTYRVTMKNYGTTGRLLLYRIASDTCAANGTLTVVYLGEAGIASPTSFETVFTNRFTPGQTYLLVVNTTGALTSQPYSITLQP
jgi:hypothetical protein